MRRRARAVGVAAGAVAVWRWILRPRLDRWGATDEEVDERLPGDELVADPASQITRAITVHAPPEDVWPWIVQLGADRGGFYSYDGLENIFGLGIHSASRIVPEWQERAIGDLVAANAGSTGGWRVVDVRPPGALVLKMVDPTTGEPARRDQGWRWEFLWTFAVRDAGLGRSRLLIRERTGFTSRVTKALLAPVGVVSWFMTQKTLRGVKARAEGLRDAGGGGRLVPPLRRSA